MSTLFFSPQCYAIKVLSRWLSGKKSSCRAGDTGFIPQLGRSPGEGRSPVFMPGKSHGQRRLAGYGPWGHKNRT